MSLGIALVVVGLMLRWWSWHVLRRVGLSYNGMMEPVRPTSYTNAGPYRVMRHPAYVGSMLVLSGLGIVWLGWGGWVLCLPAWPLFALRIHQENQLRGDGWL